MRHRLGIATLQDAVPGKPDAEPVPPATALRVHSFDHFQAVSWAQLSICEVCMRAHGFCNFNYAHITGPGSCKTCKRAAAFGVGSTDERN